MNYTIRQWNADLKDACGIHAIFKEVYPMMPIQEPELFLAMTLKHIEGVEDGLFVVTHHQKIVGFSGLMAREDKDGVRLMGAVLPQFEGQKMGRSLLERTFEFCKTKKYTEIHTMCFESHPRALSFLQTAGFVERDRIFWSDWDCQKPISAWAKKKSEMVRHAGIQIITGAEFENIREDWAQCWWKHVMISAQDIPSTIPFEEIPFEKWRPYLELPFCDRSHVYIALDGLELAGMLMLGIPENNRNNINHTSVADGYRRRGISTALKVAAIEKSRKENIRTISTQNHQNNPMYKLNHHFGFVTTEIQIEFTKKLQSLWTCL